jgi:Holliday junction resolvase RusA-like endonuclease
MPRPQSLPKRVTAHVKKPDVDKLSRCLLDSLKGVVWTDDSQVIVLSARKYYADAGSMPRAEIVVEAAERAVAVVKECLTTHAQAQEGRLFS